MSSEYRGSRLLLFAVTAVLALAFASQANAGIYVSKTPTSFLRVTLNEHRQPVLIEGIYEFECTGKSRGTAGIRMTGSEIRRYRDGSFGFRQSTSVAYDSHRKFRAKLTKGKVEGFFSYRSTNEDRCWTGKSFRKSGARFTAKRRFLNPSTYVVDDAGVSLRLTLTESGRPIRVEGSFPIRCGPDSPVVEAHVDGFLPNHFVVPGDGSFGMGRPLGELPDSVYQGLRAQLVDGKVVGSLWYRFRVSPSPGVVYSCYSGERDANPVVEFEATSSEAG